MRCPECDGKMSPPLKLLSERNAVVKHCTTCNTILVEQNVPPAS